ncbi:MAG: hypothetical protein Q4G09_08430 [Clostridia bacterium]|nr:hypothetical protein [Clostridia bacterium]
MSIITMVREIKSIHPTDLALLKTGGFYRVYGRDAYILSNLFQYKVKKEGNIVTCGFPIKSVNKVIYTLENKKINYLIIDSRDNYNINEKMNFKNLNRYIKEYETSKIYVNNQIRIEKINNYLLENVKKENIKKMLKEIESIINANREI